MQELIYKAGRIIEHGRKLILGLGDAQAQAQAQAQIQVVHIIVPPGLASHRQSRLNSNDESRH